MNRDTGILTLTLFTYALPLLCNLYKTRYLHLSHGSQENEVKIL